MGRFWIYVKEHELSCMVAVAIWEEWCFGPVKEKILSVLQGGVIMKRFCTDSSDGIAFFLTPVSDALNHHVLIPTWKDEAKDRPCEGTSTIMSGGCGRSGRSMLWSYEGKCVTKPHVIIKKILYWFPWRNCLFSDTYSDALNLKRFFILKRFGTMSHDMTKNPIDLTKKKNILNMTKHAKIMQNLRSHVKKKKIWNDDQS